MTVALPISADQCDALQEVCNVAMGAAGEALANFAHVFVELPVPKIRYLHKESMTEALDCLTGDVPLSGVIQVYEMGGVACYAFTVITDNSIGELSALTQLPATNDEETTELLCRLSDTLTSICLPSLAQQLGFEQHGVGDGPSLIALHQPMEHFFPDQYRTRRGLLTAEINYHLEDHTFNCDLVLVFPDTSVPVLVKSLEALLDF